MKKDSADDWRAPVRFIPAQVTTFTAGPARPDPVPHIQSEYDKHFNASADLVFVHQFQNSTLFGICQGNDWHRMIMEWTANSRWLACVIAHEMGTGSGSRTIKERTFM